MVEVEKRWQLSECACGQGNTVRNLPENGRSPASRDVVPVVLRRRL